MSNEMSVADREVVNQARLRNMFNITVDGISFDYGVFNLAAHVEALYRCPEFCPNPISASWYEGVTVFPATSRPRHQTDRDEVWGLATECPVSGPINEFTNEGARTGDWLKTLTLGISTTPDRAGLTRHWFS